MAPDTKRHRKPSITVTRSDHAALALLAESVSGRSPGLGEQLFAELDRARVVADSHLRAGVVRMGSTLRFTTDMGEARTVKLVFPAEAEIAEGKVSILTPIGAALIGLSAGQSIDWTARDGRVHRLSVQSVDESVSAAPPARQLDRVS